MIRRIRNGGIATALLAGGLLFSGSASAVTTPFLSDDFENGVGGTYGNPTNPVWTPWTGVNGTSTTPVGSQNLMTTSSNHNHTPGGSKSALTPESSPADWNGYADFGSTTNGVYAEVWTFEDNNNTTPSPIINMLSLIGEGSGATANQPAFTDFLYVGVVGQGGSSTHYGTRSLTGGFTTSGIAREQGFTKLRIEADALSAGGQVRFFVDTPSLPQTQIATTTRTNNALRFVRLGTNSDNFQNVWYDDVLVVPEPATAAVLGLGALGALARRRRARQV